MLARWSYLISAELVLMLWPVGAARGDAIFVMRPDGSDVRRVAQVEGRTAHGSPQWSHDGKQLAFDASANGNRSTRFYVVNVDGSGLRAAGDHEMPAWAPDDKQLAFESAGNGGSKAGIWVQNLDGQGRTWIGPGQAPRWSPDGSQIAYTDRNFVYSLDLLSGQERRLHGEPIGRIQVGFDWSPDGQHLAVVREHNNTRELLILGSEPPLSRLANPELRGGLSYSPDGRRLAVTINRRIHLLEVDGAAAPQVVPNQQGENTDPAWSGDGGWIAFASSRSVSAAPVAALPAGRWQLEEIKRHKKGTIVYGLAFTPDGRRLVMGGDPVNTGVQVWDWNTDETKDLGGQGISIAMFPDGNQFATNWLSNAIQIINLQSGEVTREFDHGSTVRTIAVSKDGRLLVSGGVDNVLNVWDVASGNKIVSFNQHKNWLTRAIFTPDGKEVVSAGQNHQVFVWDAKTGKIRLRIEHPANIWGLAVSPDGRQLITGTGGDYVNHPVNLIIDESQDTQLRVWDLASGKLTREMPGHTHAVFSIDISPDGRLAVSGSWDGTTRLWDLESGTELSRTEPGEGHATRVLFSPDGQHVAVGGGVARVRQRITEFPNEQLRLYRLVPAKQEGAH